MCYIFNCFGWTLDLLQRLITFFLACFVVMVVCIGLVIGTGTGIAYGYNYFLAEYLSLHAPNITGTYMVVGTKPSRRSMEREYVQPDVFTIEGNATDSRKFSSDVQKSVRNISEFTPRHWWEAGHIAAGSSKMKSQHNHFKTSKSVDLSTSFIIDSTIWPNADSPVMIRHFIKKLNPTKESIVSTQSNFQVTENEMIEDKLEDDEGNVNADFRKTIDIVDTVLEDNTGIVDADVRKIIDIEESVLKDDKGKVNADVRKTTDIEDSVPESKHRPTLQESDVSSRPDDSTDDDPNDAVNVLPV